MTHSAVCSPVSIGEICAPLNVLLRNEIGTVLDLLFFSRTSIIAAVNVVILTICVFRRGHVRGLPTLLVLRSWQPLQYSAFGRLVTFDLIVSAPRMVFGAPSVAGSSQLLLLVMLILLGGGIRRLLHIF